MTSYDYMPLQRLSHTRILLIDPSLNRTDPLSGKFVHVSLDNYPAYDALFCTWGEPELCNRISLNSIGTGLAMTANLDLALGRMRGRAPLGMPTRILGRWYMHHPD